MKNIAAITEPIGDQGDILAGVAVIGSMAQILPPIAALLAIIWTGIRIYEWGVAKFSKKKVNYED